jgi:hypothetical protein
MQVSRPIRPASRSRAIVSIDRGANGRGEDRAGGNGPVGAPEDVIVHRLVFDDRLEHQLRLDEVCNRVIRVSAESGSDPRCPEAATTWAMPATICPAPNDEDVLEPHGSTLTAQPGRKPVPAPLPGTGLSGRRPRSRAA